MSGSVLHLVKPTQAVLCVLHTLRMLHFVWNDENLFGTGRNVFAIQIPIAINCARKQQQQFAVEVSAFAIVDAQLLVCYQPDTMMRRNISGHRS